MSSDKRKTKEQLLDELALLRQRVAELEATVAESKKAEVKYTALVESGNDGIIVIQDGLLKFANQKIFEMTGFSPEEVTGKPFLPFVAPEYGEVVADRYKRRMAGEEVPPRYEIEILAKDDKKMPVEINASTIEYEGRPADLAILRDMTERKKAEDALRESEIAFKTLSEQLPNAVYINQNGKIVYANKKAEEITGYNREELYAADFDFLTLIAPEDMALIKANFNKHSRGEDIPPYEYRLITREGKRLDILSSTKLITYRGERAILGIVTDITERKQAEEELRQSEERYSALVEKSNDSIVLLQDGLIKYANPATTELTGFPLAEVIGKPFIDFIAPECRNLAADRYTRRIAGEEVPSKYEMEILRKDCRKIPIETSAVRIEYNGKPAVMAIRRDITERKQAEKALKASEERFRNLVENAPVGIVIIDSEGRLADVNEAIWKMHGYQSKDEYMKAPVADRYYDLSDRERWMAQVRETGKITGFELRNKRKDGSLFWASITAIRQTGKSGEPQYITVIQDITQQKQAEVELKVSEERYRNLVENAPTGIVIVDSEGRLIEANEAIQKMHGYKSKDEFMKTSISDRYYDPNDRVSWRAIMQEKGKVEGFELRNKRKDGSLFWASVTAIRQTGKSGETQYITVIQDITQQKKAEDELRESEERYRALIKLGSEVGEAVVMLWDTEKEEAVHAFASEAWAKITGYSQVELLDMPFRHLVHPKDRQTAKDRYFKRLRGETMPGLYEITIIRKDGTEVIVEVTGASSNYRGKPAQVLYIRDITQRKKMEEQFMAQDRLASIGQLVSGVAHELNNPLTSVIGFSELLLQRELPDDIKEDLKTVNKEAKRTATIVKNLLTFARKQPQEKQAVDINQSINNVLELRAYEQTVNNINVNTRLASALPEISGNNSQLQQVFINIIINAEFFMTEVHQKGTLTVTTERIGNFVRASFTDDGPGISQENMRQLFNPFFTTKEVGQGTGLGLSICHGIITEHGGKIWAESEPGKGATFVIELPIPKPKQQKPGN